MGTGQERVCPNYGATEFSELPQPAIARLGLPTHQTAKW